MITISVSIQKRLFMKWNTKVGVAVIKQGSKTCISINIYTWNLLYLTCTTSCTPDFLCKSGHVQVQSYMSPGKACFLFLPFLQRDWISHPPTCKNLRGSQCIFIFLQLSNASSNSHFSNFTKAYCQYIVPFLPKDKCSFLPRDGFSSLLQYWIFLFK